MIWNAIQTTLKENIFIHMVSLTFIARLLIYILFNICTASKSAANSIETAYANTIASGSVSSPAPEPSTY